MIIKQIYTDCLSQGSYYIQSNGEAAIVDPLRDIDLYMEMAKEHDAEIKYVFETHFHADFVSGHVDLAKKTGAEIVFGPTTMKTGYHFLVGQDEQEFKLGKIKIKLLHTPGHTMESSCYLLIDENGKAHSIFTGDTLFIGDVGRPDLAQKVISELTQEKLAALLFDSLRTKILPLNDDIIIYPGHGAGSACGKMMSDATTDTLGHQKNTNYALRSDMNKDEFIDAILTGLTPPPGYFPQNVLMNIQGYNNIDKVIKKGTQALRVEDFEIIMKDSPVIILDTRDAQVFAKGHIPNSFNIGLQGSFANWVGTTIINTKQPLLIIADDGKEGEVVRRLARIGFDNVIGYLKGGINAWKAAGKKIKKIPSITAQKLAQISENENINILDVRRHSEYNSEHLINAINVPLDYIMDAMKKINKNKTYYVHCKSGYRSMVFISILKSKGYNNLIDIKGGMEAIKKTGQFNLSKYKAPISLL